MLINSYVYASGGGSSEVPLPSGLPIWARYKASHQSEAGDAKIVSMLDSSGNDRHGTQATAARRAIKRTAVSGLTGNTTAMEFTSKNGIGDTSPSDFHCYTLPSMTSIGSKAEIWVFVKHLSGVTGNGHRLWPTMGGASDGYYLFSNDSKIYETFGRSSRINAIANTVTITDWHTYDVSSEQGVGGTVLRQNNSVIHTANNTTQAFASAPIIGGYIGNAFGAADKMIAEIIIFDDHLTTQQRSDLEDYKDAEYLGG